MALEGFDYIENMSKKEAQRRAKEALDAYISRRGADDHTLLIDTEFYLRRVRDIEERRSRTWDKILEGVIIALILFEIFEGYQQAKILEQLVRATQAVANRVLIR